MKRIITTILFLIMGLTFLKCTNSEVPPDRPDPIQLSNEKDITSFIFTAALNSDAGVTDDVVGVIFDTEISAVVPNHTDVTGLKVTFSTTGDTVQVGTTSQLSGTTGQRLH